MPKASLEFNGKKYLLNAIATKDTTKGTVEREAKRLRELGYLARIVKYPLENMVGGRMVKSGKFEYCIYVRRK